MITSKSNELIKHVKSLHQKKYRDEYQQFFVEGIKLVREAIFEKKSIYKIIICEETLKEEIDIKDYPVEFVSEPVFEFISDTKTPQGIIAIINSSNKVFDLDSFTNNDEKVIFALDNIQDPGNLGTIIRTLDCAGINSLILSNGTVDLYNPKVVRGSMGAIFRVNIYENIDLLKTLKELKKIGYKIVVTDLNTDKYHYDIDYNQKMIVVIGNEANGVSQEIKDLADVKIKIPMLGRTESLNAGVAASLIAYENVRNKK